MNQNNNLAEAMMDSSTCPVCGAPLARGRGGEICPACLLQAAMGDDMPNKPASPEGGVVVVVDHGFPSIAERLGARIGRYKLLEQIGEGGFGVVWMAEQEQPVRRRVALKIIKPGMDTREVVARFEAERQALAMMAHPNIASVFDGGATETGRPYFVMELVKGVPITTYCDANHLSTRERLELFMEVCQAVQHAHQKGVIHRDLKPSNILVTVQDDRAVPKVIDFGVAKATQAQLTEKTLFTCLNQWIGTPEYMSPEQAGLGSLDVDTRSDIYSLGVLLYELLTGRPPFDTHKLLAAGYDAVMRTIREEEPPRPSTRLGRLSAEEITAVAANRGAEPAKLNRLLRGDLDWIVMKALEKDRRRRYETANGLADDLQHHLNNEPVAACPPGNLYRFQKLVRRNKRVFGAAAAVLAAILVGLGVSTWSLFQEKKARQRATIAEQEEYRQRMAAEEAREVAEQERLGAKERLVRLSVSNGTRLLGESDDSGALLWFAEALHLDQGNAEHEANHRLRMASILRQCPMPLQMWFHAEMVNTAVFSPDDRSVLTASRDKSARVWDALTGEPITPPLLQGGDVLWAGFSPDGKRVFTATGTGVNIWDARTGKPMIPPIQHLGVTYAEFSRDGEKVVTASSDGTVVVWNAATGEALLLPMRHRSQVNCASFSPDGRRLITASNDNSAQIWDLTTGQACLPPLQHANAVQQARFNFDGSRVVTMSWDNTVRIWDATTGQPTTPPMLHQVIIFTAAFSPDGRWVVTASNDGYARVWNAATGKLVTPPLRHPKSVLAANFNPAGDRVVTCGFDGAARVWDVATGELVLPLLRHGGMVNSAVFSSDGHRVLTTSSDGVARLWDIEPRKLTFAPWAEEDPQIVGASEDGTRLITRDAAEQVRIWDTDTWQAVAPPIRIENPDLLTLSRDLTRLVAASHDAAQTGTQLQFKVWEVATARLMSQIDGPAGPAGNVHFSADGRLALIVRDNEVERWDVTQGKLPGPPLKHPSPVSCVVFSADACRCATSNSNHVHIWETATGKEILPTLECPNEVNVLSFSPDGGLFATACSDAILEGREARVWDAVTGKPVSPPLKHGDGVTFVVFSPDGRRVVTCGEDRAVRIWDARTGKPLTSPLLHAAMPSFAAFSTDGRRLVTSGRYPMVRVWDAMTGEPLTLPMICDGVADRADFLAHGRYVLGGGAGHLQILDLPVESRPTADLRSLACLLTSSKIDHTGVFEPLSAEALKEAWTSLKANYPDDISPLKRHASNIPPGATDADSLTPAAAERLVLAARLRARGAHYAQFTQWPLALADLTKSIEGNPDEHETWYQLAPLLLETGDAAAYRKHCQAMLARFGRTRDPAIAGRTARVCLLLPLDGADLETACHLAEIAVTLGKEHPWRVNFQATKGLAEYRQAHFAQAVEWTRQALSQPDDNCAWDVQANAVLAMALHRLNQGGQAREALRKATQLDDTMLPKFDSGDLGPSWHAWIFARILLREAKALIEGGNKTGEDTQ